MDFGGQTDRISGGSFWRAAINERSPLGGIYLVGLLLLLVGCTTTELTLPDLNRSPRAAYERQLRRQHGDFIADRFYRVARTALRDSVRIDLPYEEVASVDTFVMQAATYFLDLEWGQALELDWRESTVPVLVELSPANDLGETSYQGGPADTLVRIPVPATGTYLLHVQPLWRTSGRLHLRARRTAAVGFPVVGKGNADIWSKWGDPRDGGKRKHEGIDIFAKRGTPVVAVTDGRTRLRNGGLGGKTVWLGDEEGRSWYYAHLDSQYVATGDHVDAGDTLGTVGNTGNARRTRPHLHFGLYRRGRGATDPLPWVQYYPDRYRTLLARPERTRARGRLGRAGAALLDRADRGAETKSRLSGRSRVYVLGATGDYYRVRTLHGRVGYVSRRALARRV